MMRGLAFHKGAITHELFNEEASPRRQILSQRSQQGGQNSPIISELPTIRPESSGASDTSTRSVLQG
jgi:hypothetical protein